MRNQDFRNERLVALVVAAALALNYPLLGLFNNIGSAFGIPSLYLYLFLSWAAIIALIAMVTRNGAATVPRRPSAQEDEPDA